MKVFVGFGYNLKDEWVNELIIPFIETLGCEVITGEEMHGERLSDGVKARIKDCDACIGFLTKRGEPDQNGGFTTHWWVIEEMAAAFTLEKSVFVIREKGIDPQKGILGDRQRFEFGDKAFLLLEIAKFIMKEKTQLAYKTLMLLPAEFSEAIKGYFRFAKCTYTFLYKARYYEPEETQLVRMQGGYGVIIKKIPSEEAQIDISISLPDRSIWSSGYVSVGLMNITLQKDN